jgi:hypothetical protein
MIQEFDLQGLDAQSIERSMELSHSISGTRYLNKEAFLPTGLALGCPLPDAKFTGRLTEFSFRAADYLSTISGSLSPSFAFVPPDSYHITVLNKSHFEVSSSIIPVTEEEVQKAEEIVFRLGVGPISIDARSAILTSSGKVLVRGYPTSGALDSLRRRIGESVSTLNAKTPEGATIKLGHLLVPLNEARLALFLDWLGRIGRDFDTRLVFTDLYTQVRRVPL